MAGSKIAIVGAGRLGRLLADRLPRTCRKVIISRQKEHAIALADEVGGIASDQVAAVRGCDRIFLAVPGANLPGLLEELRPHLSKQSVLVNMATEWPTERVQAALPEHRVVAGKVIGHAREMAHGSPGVIVLDQADDALADELTALLSGLGPVVRASEEIVLQANTAVAEEMVRAEQRLRARLEQFGLPRDLIRVAITTTGPGVLRSLSEGDAGPFVQEIMTRLEQEEASAT